MNCKITSLRAMEILDSRGNPTLRAFATAIKRIIRGVRRKDAREVAHGVLKERRAKDVQTYLEQMMSKRFPQVMSVYGRAD